jgi:hypothetical protein
MRRYMLLVLACYATLAMAEIPTVIGKTNEDFKVYNLTECDGERCWDGNTQWTYDDIVKTLPYIPERYQAKYHCPQEGSDGICTTDKGEVVGHSYNLPVKPSTPE